MKKAFKLLLLLCLVLGTVFLFAACNKTPATPEESSPEQTTTPEETTLPTDTNEPVPFETLNGMTKSNCMRHLLRSIFLLPNLT